MRIKNCDVIRQELDELLPRGKYAEAIADHLAECSDCRDFQDKQLSLHRLVGSLGTVEAPSDFDSRLRARLANEAGNSRYHLRVADWSLANRGAVAAVALLLVLGTLIGVRRLTTKDGMNEIAEHPLVIPPAKSQPVAVLQNLEARIPAVPEVSPEPEHVGPSTSRNPVRSSRSLKRSLMAADFSSEGAPRFVSRAAKEASSVPAFPIDAPGQVLRFSLDDGQGNARTISLPTVSFGSQRVLAVGGNHLSPRTVW